MVINPEFNSICEFLAFRDLIELIFVACDVGNCGALSGGLGEALWVCFEVLDKHCVPPFFLTP
ncbi:hypothetical protein EJD97_017981 [Solanum chilense]|uniref:Uncharacterized protein n=1 Tax=Solanum chilense TaxID=4083 RepID=A0A6N2B6L5_SOLCI|nr:hypothetical protein EJD97_017981 [Solanum chilense]